MLMRDLPPIGTASKFTTSFFLWVYNLFWCKGKTICTIFLLNTTISQSQLLDQNIMGTNKRSFVFKGCIFLFFFI